MKNIISFYRDCYFTDKNRKYIRDIYSKDIEFLRFIDEREELVNSFLPYIDIEPEYADELNKRAYLYRKEKDIAYCSVLLIGIKISEDEKKTFFCSPLFIQNAEIIENGESKSLELKEGALSFNDMLIENVCPEEKSDDNIAGKSEALLVNNSFTQRDITALTSFLEEYIPGLDSIEMNNYPKLLGEKELKNFIRSVKARKNDYFTLLPCSFIALINKPNEARGVVDELDSISNSGLYSAPLQALFDKPNTAANSNAFMEKGYVPSVLSSAQEHALASAAKSENSLIIGPPGTGKSYTIASLAMEHLSRGKTVLIASKMDQAVNVIADKIEEQFEIEGCLVRGGKNEYQRELKNFLKRLLSGMYRDKDITGEFISSLRKNLETLDSKLEKLETQLNSECVLEIKNGKLAAIEDKSFFEKIKAWFAFRKYKKKKALWDIYEEYEKLLDGKIRQIRQLLEKSNILRINESLKTHRDTLNTFLKAIRSRTGGKQEDLFNKMDFSILLKIFPIWLVNLTDISKVLPLENELFDLAIIDEATQCDIASCIPIMQRAKRVAITGDPNQLRHISFLPKKKQKEFLDKYQIGGLEQFDYRKKSILDFFSENLKDQKNVIFLDEHYRSLPRIISFSNQRFYGGRLKIMTEKPVNYETRPVSLHKCNGERDEKGINEGETKLIIKHLQHIIDESGIDTQSIGLLSPFRKQVDHIYYEVIKALGYEVLRKHNILAGTAHSFQGEERDIMLISLAVDDNSHNAAFRFLEKPDVFNVSITRAKQEQRIFYSFNPENLKKGSILADFMAHHSAGVKAVGQNNETDIHDLFAEEVSDELRQAGYNTLISNSIAGHTMDLTVYKSGKSLGIDLIGYPGDFEEVYSLDRYKMFKRAGLNIMPLPYTWWKLDKDRCLVRIWNELTQISL